MENLITAADFQFCPVMNAITSGVSLSCPNNFCFVLIVIGIVLAGPPKVGSIRAKLAINMIAVNNQLVALTWGVD
jgi:hypothetical protein